MQSLIRFPSLRRMGAALAASLGIAAGLIPVPSAIAATVSLTGGTTASCTYSSMAGNAAGDFTFTCSGGSSPGTLSLNLAGTAASIPVSTGSTTFAVQRLSGTSGAISGTLAVTTGNCIVNPSTVSFPSDSTTPSSTVTLGAGTAVAGTSCTVTLTSASAPVVAPASHTVSVVNPNENVTFQFTSATSTAFFSGTPVPVSITIARTGGTAGSYNVPFYVQGSLVDGSGNIITGGGTVAPPLSSVTGNPPYAYGVASFPEGTGSQTITYTPPTAVPAGVTSPATINYTLLDPMIVGPVPPGQTAALGTTKTNAMTVQTQAGCATSANFTVPWNGGQTLVSQVKRNETGAVSINPTPALIGSDGYMSVVVKETSTTGDQADIHYTLSACPGDFTPAIIPGSNCAQHSQYTGGTMRFSIGPKPVGTPWYLYVCELPLGTMMVYLNFRQIKRPTPVPPSAPGTPSCQFTTCPIYVQFN